MSEMISIRGLTKKFGAFTAVDGIDLSVQSGEVLGFLGPNGAGKSTTMKMVTGFLEPTAGSISVCGHDVAREPVAAKKRIGYLPEGAPLYGDMTPAGFLDFVGGIRGFDGAERKRRIERVAEKIQLQEVMYQPIDTLSKGFKRRVGLAQAILHDPDVLILDEPTDGLDPNQKQQVRELIAEMSPDRAIVISTHILEEVEAICSRAVIIARGRLLADGTAESLQARLPYHNAVVMTLDTKDAAGMTEALKLLSGVDNVEQLSASEGVTRLRVNARDARPVISEVADLVKAKNIPVSELSVEKGRLDDIFRRITKAQTTGEAGNA
ncbi:MAG: ABC transporter ATP-binding protein [Rhodospirillales bacterium]